MPTAKRGWLRRGIIGIAGLAAVVSGVIIACSPPSVPAVQQVGPALETVSATTVPVTSSALTSPTSVASIIAPTTVAATSPSSSAPGHTAPDKPQPTVVSAKPTTASLSSKPSTPTKVTVTAKPPQPKPGIPAVIRIPFASTNHPNGVPAIAVTPHGYGENGELWVPGPDTGIADWSDQVSWLNEPGFAAPFTTHGAVIIGGHINYGGTVGALSDLAEYAQRIGQTFTVTMSDGRTRTYRIQEVKQINKEQLAAEPNLGPLHVYMFGQLGIYGPANAPTESLRLISCGGEFDPSAGSYLSNVVLTAVPIS